MLTIFISLTQDASLREVDNLREQIYRIKGGSTVSGRESNLKLGTN